MTTRRNAFDNDILDDLGIITTPTTTDPAPADLSRGTRTQAAAPSPATEAGPRKTKRIGVDVTEKVWIATKIVAAQQGTTVADLIRGHLAHLIQSQSGAEPPSQDRLETPDRT